MMSQYNSQWSNYAKGLKNQNPKSKQGTMRKRFSIPLEVYMADHQYWDNIIKNKQFHKHPEWQVGDERNSSSLKRGIIVK